MACRLRGVESDVDDNAGKASTFVYAADSRQVVGVQWICREESLAVWTETTARLLAVRRWNWWTADTSGQSERAGRW